MAQSESYDQQALIGALMRGDWLAPPAPQIQLRQTHLSWVLIAGEHVYKIKKAVRLDFVDFSTLERRRAACYDEIRLNRRFAPRLYLDVVAIGGSLETPVLGAETNAFEYAVRMQRFDESEQLSALVDRNGVSVEELARFGAQLARIHAASSTCGSESYAQRTFDTILGNVRELERASAPSVSLPRGAQEQTPRSLQSELAALEEWSKQQWSRVAQIAAHRAATGRVRECHGDLHAANVVRIEGRLVAFDCIEFSEDLRCIDVMNDVAFLVMDLIARAAGRLAYAFLNGWLEESGDYAGLTLLRLFAVYRALVRAKVAVLEQRDQRAGRYLAAAQKIAQSRRPILLITCGLSGSGKTWLSSRLLQELELIRVRSDVERKRMAGLRADESSRSLADEDIYSLQFNERVYALLQERARMLIEAGESAIIDAAFLKRHERLAFVELARQVQVPIRILHCVAPTETLEQRLRERQRAGTDASEADVPVMVRQLGAWEPFAGAEQEAVMDVVTADEHSVMRCIEAVREAARGSYEIGG